MNRVRDLQVSGRVPPQNPDIEQAVLGAVMLEPDSYFAVREIIGPESFYLDQHGLIFEAFVALIQRGLKPDLPAVLDELKRKNLLEKVGGAGYVAALLSSVPTAAHVEYHSYLVAEQSTLRRLIHACHRIIESAYAQDEPPETVLDSAEKAILEIARFGKSKGYEELEQVFNKLFNKLEMVVKFKEAHPGEAYFAGAKCGYTDLDERLRGFHPGCLYILAARPSVGKTSLALNMALNVAKSDPGRLPVLIFSLEMSSEALALRLLSSESRISIAKIEGADLSDEEWFALSRETRAISDCKIVMNDSGVVTVRDIANMARRVISRYGGLSLLVVDYLQLMSSGQKTESRVVEVGAISRGLKSLALQLGVPILACSQLSRQVEQRKEQRPMLHDLRESGSIEQDADVVMFLSSWISKDTDSGAANTQAYAQSREIQRNASRGGEYLLCSIAKNRNGPTGDCPLRFEKEFCKFKQGDFPDFISKKHPAPAKKEGKR